MHSSLLLVKHCPSRAPRSMASRLPMDRAQPGIRGHMSSTASLLRGPVRRFRCARDQATHSRLSSDAAASSQDSQVLQTETSLLFDAVPFRLHVLRQARVARQSQAAEGTLRTLKSTQIISHHGMCCRGRRTRDPGRHMIGPAEYRQRSHLVGHGERQQHPGICDYQAALPIALRRLGT